MSNVKINKTWTYFTLWAFWDVLHIKNALSYHSAFNVFNYFVSTALPVEHNWQCQCNKGCVCTPEWIVRWTEWLDLPPMCWRRSMKEKKWICNPSEFWYFLRYCKGMAQTNKVCRTPTWAVDRGRHCMLIIWPHPVHAVATPVDALTVNNYPGSLHSNLTSYHKLLWGNQPQWSAVVPVIII